MIFIHSALRQFGDNPLIIQLKAKEFFQGKKLGKDEFDRYFSIFSNNDIPRFTIPQRNNSLLVFCYFDSEYNQNALTYYYMNYTENPNLYDKVSSGTQTTILYFFFNLIEFEIKTRTRPESELKRFFHSLNAFSSLGKTFEENLLFQYYLGVLKYFLKEYDKALVYSTEIILDIDEQTKNSQFKQNDLIRYIQFRNILLRIKIFENYKEINSRHEIVANIESLFELCKVEKEDVAIKLGIQLNEYQSSGEYLNCIKTLEELNTILHKEMLFGRSHPNIINEFIYINSMLGYYNSLIGKFDQVKRFSHKIDKNIAFLREFNETNKNNSIEYLNQFEFINITLKNITKSEISNDEQNNQLEKYKSVLGNKINEKDDVILNFFILKNRSDDLINDLFEQKKNYYYDLVDSKQILDNNSILNCYLYFYNYISILSKSKTNENFMEIKTYSKKIIDYTNELIINNDSLKNIFQLSYFKDIFNKIYFAYLYSIYSQNNYEEALRELDNYNNRIQYQYELNTNQKSYYDIMKIEGDCYFKLNQYGKASKIYSDIIDNSKDNGLVRLNLGICNILLGKINNAYEDFHLSISYFKGKKNNNKLSVIKSTLESLDTK